MRKLFTMFAMLVCVLLIGCNNNAKVEFSLKVDGDFDVGKGVKIDLVADTHNVQLEEIQEQNCIKLTQENVDAYMWLMREVKEPILRNLPNGAHYDVKVNGFISWNGLKLEVDEHWTYVK